MNRHFVFELKLSYRGFWGNLLAFIPSVAVSLATAPIVSLQWMGFELSLWCGLLGDVGTVFFLTPHVSFTRINRRHKEKYDFQFSWFGANYRKFFGSRSEYEEILKRYEGWSFNSIWQVKNK